MSWWLICASVPSPPSFEHFKWSKWTRFIISDKNSEVWDRASVPGSVAETMAPKNRQSVKKKSPASCPTCFISITQPYISNLTEEQQVDLRHHKQHWLYCHNGHFNTTVIDTYGIQYLLCMLWHQYRVAHVESEQWMCFLIHFSKLIFLPNDKTGNYCP